MDNVLNHIFDLFGRNKKNLLYAIIAYVVIVVVVIVIIWMPEKKDYLEFENVNVDQKQEELAAAYINDIGLYFNVEDKEKISDLISQEYLSYTGKTREQVIDMLEKDDYFSLYTDLKGMEVYVDGNTYVYSTTMYSNNKTQRINIIESYPYKYTIAFDDFYKFSEPKTSQTKQDIKFTINRKYNNLKYIELDVQIQNLNKTAIRMDFNSSTCIQAVLEDGKTYNIVNLVSTEEYTNIETNTSLKKTLVFEIPAQLQEKINYIVFNRVETGFSTSNIKFDI